MADLSFSDLAMSAGQTTGNWLKDIGNAAADFTCGLYHDHPGWITNLLNPVQAGQGFGTGLMNSLCSPRPGYQAPSTGVLACWRFTGLGVTQGQPDPNFSFDLFATGYKPEYKPNPNNPYNQSALAPYVDGVFVGVESDYAYTPGTESITKVSNANQGSGANHTYGSCGNLSTSNSPSQTPTPQQLTVNSTVNNVNTSVKFVGASAENGILVNVGGVNVRFDHNGMTLNDNSSTSNSQLSNQVANIEANVNSLVFAPSATLTSTINLPGDQGAAKDKKGIRIVTIDLTQVPSNSFVHVGPASSNVLRAGYFNFTKGNYLFPGEPVRYLHSCFLAPLAADGYVYNLHVGFEGFATEYSV